MTTADETSVTPQAGAQRARAEGHPLRYLTIAFWVIAIVAGAWQAWAFRNTISTDGISYLDMGDAIAHGDWAAAVNGYWSPLYPTLIAFGLALFKPATVHEFALVHAVNFAIYLGALGCFGFFMRRLLAAVRNAEALPQWLLTAIGYCLFIWTSLELITNSGASPDMAVAAFVYLGAGILLKIGSGKTEWWRFAALGVALGFGSLAKAPLFPLAFVFFGLTLFAPGARRLLLGKAIAALVVFGVVAAPYVISLSRAKGRATFGDSGKLNYGWYVDGAAYRHWQGGPLGVHSEVAPRWSKGPVSSGVAAHPTRRILDAPPVYEFNGPVKGTYAVWYDPSYWDEGLKPRFDPAQQLRKIAVNVKFMYSLLLNVHIVQLYREGQLYKIFSPVLALAWLVLFWKARKTPASFGIAAGLLLAFSGAALAMYALVYCEPRHLAPFVVLLYLGLFAAIRLPENLPTGFIKGLAGVMLAVFFVATAGGLATTRVPRFDDWEVASALRTMGVGEGTTVASVEYSNHANVKWARLARARIVAEVYTDAFAPRGYFWKLDTDSQTRALHAFRTAGAQVVVASDLPKDVPAPQGWERVGTTKYFLYRLGQL